MGAWSTAAFRSQSCGRETQLSTARRGAAECRSKVTVRAPRDRRGFELGIVDERAVLRLHAHRAVAAQAEKRELFEASAENQADRFTAVGLTSSCNRSYRDGQWCLRTWCPWEVLRSSAARNSHGQRGCHALKGKRPFAPRVEGIGFTMPRRE